MVFLLHYQYETESNIDDNGEFDSKGTPEQIQDDVHMSDLEDQISLSVKVHKLEAIQKP